MEYEALGMIEVIGFLGAVEAADTALKAANVTFVQAEVISGGLTTVQIVGDVGAVQSAVEAAVSATEKLDCLIGSHVIPRMDAATAKMVFSKLAKKEKVSIEEPMENTMKSTEVSSVNAAKESLKKEIQEVVEESLDQELAQMKVVDLRKMASQMEVTSLSKKEIKFANKKALIDAIQAEKERNDK
ncbi:BMC domain-containing protein [Isobaculum melis]|uniref:Energy-coupling factor transport system substrate-specific component n=1 Tax=Isobaculum melis TaxID=142588 RepID=A0A1H9U552_9LACT|nr:BMC domain-containing protein [Isobaculum melis]SES04294.1 energy-coupling factor transport system substrate-specific component [Isobaculum melis]